MKARLLKAISIFGGILMILQLCEPLIVRLMVHNLTENSIAISKAADGASAFGIIGGADGPTAIYIAGTHFVPKAVSLAVCLIMTVVPAIIVWRDKKENE